MKEMKVYSKEDGVRIELADLRSESPSVKRKVLDWRNGWEVRRWMYQNHEIQLDEHRCWLLWVKDNPDKYRAFVVYADGEPVGLTGVSGVNNFHKFCEAFIYIVEARGVAVRVMKKLLWWAFTDLGMGHVCIETFAGNVAALRTWERAGFCREGIKPSHVQFEDCVRMDVVCMGITREQWVDEQGGRG